MSGLSKTTVSRTLTEMETDDRFARIQVGREKVVCLPEALPGVNLATAETDADD